MTRCSVIVGIKNRKGHFLQTFPSMLTQMGIEYELVLVDFHSRDGLEAAIDLEVKKYGEVTSPYLQEIVLVRLREDRPYNPRMSKNLGVHYSCGEILAFSDVDVYLSMGYLYFLTPMVSREESFLATRIQESRARYPDRIAPFVNYGNMLVHRDDFLDINGFDESIDFYGGDDDEVYHRLKLKGLREINPTDAINARHFSILHGDDIRLNEFKDKKWRDYVDRYDEIYGNGDFKNRWCEFLKNGSECEVRRISLEN